MLALHLLWADGGGGSVLLWGEDSELPASGALPRGRRPAKPVPRAHPFAASSSKVVTDLAERADSAGRVLVGAGRSGAIVGLPGTVAAPDPSPQLIGSKGDAAPSAAASALWPFEVPVLRLSPSTGLDLTLWLSTIESPDLHVGASVTALAVIAGLALDLVGAGRSLARRAAGTLPAELHRRRGGTGNQVVMPLEPAPPVPALVDCLLGFWKAGPELGVPPGVGYGRCRAPPACPRPDRNTRHDVADLLHPAYETLAKGAETRASGEGHQPR